MSLSSYLKRQSRVFRRNSTLSGLGSITEEESSSSSSNELDTKPKKKNSTKAKRRLGVSDLTIPHSSPLFTAVQGSPDQPQFDLDLDEEWRLRVDDDETTFFDFPRPPAPVPFSDSSSSSGSSSGSASPVSSGMPTTPTPSPVADESYFSGKLVRCKTIKPLTINKRSVSPLPLAPSSSSSPPSSIASSPSSSISKEADDELESDDEFYTAHASGYITLCPPLPPSFPAMPYTPAASTSTARAIRRESAVIPLPPILTSSSSSSSLSTILPSPKSSLYASPRPPPRTPVPTDALSGDYSGYAYEFEGASPTSAFSSRPSPMPSPTPSTSTSQTARLASLLSPPPSRQPAVPSDVEDDDDAWVEEGSSHSHSHSDFDFNDDLEYLEPRVIYGDDEFDDIALSPCPQSRSCSGASGVGIAGGVEGRAKRMSIYRDNLNVDELPLPPYRGWHHPASTSPAAPTPVLRSRWSSSTLSSVRSAHARSPTSPLAKGFALRRYFHGASSSSPKAKRREQAKKMKTKPKPMGSATILSPTSSKKSGSKKRLTVEDVLIIRPQPELPALASACLTPASAQWATYPSTPSPSPKKQPFLSLAPAPSNAHLRSVSASSSAPGERETALYTAYRTQRSPRRRASNASCRSAGTESSGWSYSTSSSSSSSASPSPSPRRAGSDSGCSDVSEGGEGLRRKPIPVEMFIR
ncbi:hypothetical protein R3P38DRAFT_3168313 [Favolaschia claudopus]|uniref:Uncharacterized protein n=1 Tax=Favolaschia claudopus TaxID=2862362 RepID=A0AAW0E7W5_9AGAR